MIRKVLAMKRKNGRITDENIMRIRYFVILLLLMMTGCAKEQFSEQNGIRTFDCFTVKMEEDPVTKAHIEATGAVKWDVGDRIGVYSDIQGPVEFTRGDDGRFYGETVSGTKFYAFYPWDSFQYDVENPLTLKIVPSVFWGGGVMSSPMVAVTQNNTLQFKQAVGLLHFHMKGSKHLGNLCLYSNDSTTKINGEGLVDLSQDMPVLYMNPETTWSSFSVIVDQNNADRGEWDVYFPLPPLTLPEGFTLLIDCTDPTTSENYSLERPCRSFRVSQLCHRYREDRRICSQGY